MRYFKWRSQWNDEQKSAYDDQFYKYPSDSAGDPFSPQSHGEFFVRASTGKTYFTYVSANLQDFDTNPSGAMADAIPMGYRGLWIMQRRFLIYPGGEVVASWDDRTDAPTGKWAAESDPFPFKVFWPPDPYLELRRTQSDHKRPRLPEQAVAQSRDLAAEFDSEAYALDWSRKRAASQGWRTDGPPLLVTRLIELASWH